MSPRLLLFGHKSKPHDKGTTDAIKVSTSVELKELGVGKRSVSFSNKSTEVSMLKFTDDSSFFFRF